ncbi:hypothetical protein [Brucella sp. 2716]|uniref:hypothetical protein n=1 Tax=Brucella sp. 2716 TaxID=2975052 RepID=UPI00217E2DEF|nr:hypothetical protein [Brucella sp. 2716]UWF60998.1 hypothetical protein NYO66_13090 [Brucella sp. 2716]
MNLRDIIERQAKADQIRGFPLTFNNPRDQFAQINADLVGLMGEIGEFANLVKKVGLSTINTNYVGPTLNDSVDELREELADATIYIIRLSLLLGGDLEEDILKKMDFNDKRYKYLDK